MFKRRHRLLFGALGIGVCVYVVLLLLLLSAEAASADSGIHSMADAFWYSIVTLSTVGYGDITPVTHMGRIVGMIFLILSMGIYLTLIGTAVSVFTSEAIPLIYLGLNRKRDWYYFADFGSESNTLARDIIREDEDAIIIFGEKRSEKSEEPDYPCIFLNTSPKFIVEKKRGQGRRVRVFLMQENDIGRNPHAVDLHSLPVVVYARTQSGQDSLPGNINFFHTYDCCARHFWRDHPLLLQEQQIVLIGFGNYGRALLKRAIMMNVLCSSQHVTYHIFGDSVNFQQVHSHLKDVFSVNQESDTRDSLIFHENSWAESHEVLERADRVIVCDDSMDEGWHIYWQLKRYYVLTGTLYLRTSRKAAGVAYFGTDEQIFTAREILRTTLNEAAIAVNELYRKTAKGKTLEWRELDDFLKESKIAQADHVLMKMRLLLEDNSINAISPELCAKAYWRYLQLCRHPLALEEYRRLEHLRWLRFYAYNNWHYGRERDVLRKHHPMYVPYEQLTEPQKREKDNAWHLLDSLSGELQFIARGMKEKYLIEDLKDE
ncbi:MAG: ion channel [Lachnospiraceae bacterium]|nr:ion channel [Lachnospiraceae bacterium]